MGHRTVRAVSVLALALLPSAGLCRGGEDIFRGGIGSAPIQARIGASAVAVPAERVPCSGCHGADRTGRMEGGITAPDITAGSLGASARTRPAYDRATLSRAITEGVDSGGRPLDPAMPRYQLSAADLEALLDFLTRDAVDPAIDDSVVRIELAADLEPDRRAVELALAEINGAGGIHGRRLELGSPGLIHLSLRQEPGELSCGPARLWLHGAGVSSGGIGLLPDPATMIGALAAHLARANPKLAVAGGTAGERGLAEQVARTAAAASGSVGLEGRILLWLGGAQELMSFLDAQGTEPAIIVALLDRLGPELMTMPPELLGMLRLASPVLPTDWQRPEAHDFAEYARTGRLPLAPRTAAIYAGVQVMAETLRRSGRALSPDRLCKGMSALGLLDTGALPPLRLAPGRSSALTSLHLVGLDPASRRFINAMSVPIP